MVVTTKEKKKVGMKELVVPRMEAGADRKALAQRSQEIAKAMWSGKLTANEQAMLNHICKAYGLDPLLKEIVVLGGNPYIEVGGMVRIANRDKYPPEGMILRPATEEERKLSNVPNDVEYWCCELWKKGCNKPFIEFGEADKDTVNLFGKKPKDIRAMARTRAKGRALKEAYAINLPVFEEIDLSSKYPEAIEIPAEEVEEELKGEEKKGTESSPEEKEGSPYKVRLERAVRFKNLLGEKHYYAVLSGYGCHHANEIKDFKTFDQFLKTCEKVYDGKKEEK